MLVLLVLDKYLYGLKVLTVINSKVEQAFDCSKDNHHNVLLVSQEF